MDEYKKNIQYWAALTRDPNVRAAALKRAVALGANEWIWEGDARHFWQFADDQDKAAFAALTKDECIALIGPMQEEDWEEPK